MDDIFVAKLDANGDFAWAHGFGELNSDRGFAIDLDASDNVFVTGRFSGDVDFDPGASQFLLSDSQGNDGFVLKLDSDGDFDWAGSLGGTSGDLEGNAIRLDSSENMFIAGFFTGSADFDPGTGVESRTSNGSRDVFVVQLTQVQPLIDPIATIDSISTPRIEGTQIDVAATATDADSDDTTLNYTYEVFKNGGISPFATGGGVNQKSFSFTPDDNGSYDIVLTVTDIDNLTAQTSETILVDNADPSPAIDSVSAIRIEGTQIDVSASATDPAGGNDTLTYTYDVFKDGGLSPVVSESGIDQTSFSFTPGDGGSYEIVLTVDDEDGGSASDSVVIDVEAVNLQPTALPQSATVTEDGRVSVTLEGTDTETLSTELAFTIVSLPTSGALFTPSGDKVEVGDAFTGPPTLDYLPGASREGAGSDAFLFNVTDTGDGAAAPQTSDDAQVSISIVQAVADGAVTIDEAGVLRVGGTSGNDHILITRSFFGNRLKVWINGHRTGPDISAADVSEVHAWGRAGKDSIVILGVGADTYVHGGEGNDRILGDYRSDLIFGGEGNDLLLGGFGDDLLVGGADRDLLLGSCGDDILIGGDLDETLVLDELYEAVEQWSEEHLIADNLEDGVLDDGVFDLVFGGFGYDWTA